MIADDYQRMLDRCGGRQEPLVNQDRWAALQGWREVYAARLHSATGHWKYGQFEWHVFSCGYAPALCGARAALAYDSESPPDFVVCPETAKLPAFRMAAAVLPHFEPLGKEPDYLPLGEDVYVWPADLAWTMAFTHEESWGLGPYFCRREWVLAESLGRRGRRRGRT